MTWAAWSTLTAGQALYAVAKVAESKMVFRTGHAGASHEGMRLGHEAYTVLVVRHEVAWLGHAILAVTAVVEWPFHAALVIGPVSSWLAQRNEKPSCLRQHTIGKLDRARGLREVDVEA
jgi:hypothetical protein